MRTPALSYTSTGAKLLVFGMPEYQHSDAQTKAYQLRQRCGIEQDLTAHRAMAVSLRLNRNVGSLDGVEVLQSLIYRYRQARI